MPKKLSYVIQNQLGMTPGVVICHGTGRRRHGMGHVGCSGTLLEQLLFLRIALYSTV